MMARASLCLGIIATGLALRRFGLGLGVPGFVVKYGGSALWGAMIFSLVAIAGRNFSSSRAATVSIALAAGVELFRLVHSPWLDHFRLTLLGALLLGRIFSVWNILAYVVGIALTLLADRLIFVNTPAPHSPS